MDKLFSFDSPIMRFLTRVADLLILNLLAVLCSIPIVTWGPAQAALNYMCLKIVRDEDTYIAKGFFGSFKENLKPGIALGLIFQLAALILTVDLFVFYRTPESLPNWLKIVVLIAIVVIAGFYVWAFPLLGRFDNTAMGTLKNAMAISIGAFPRTLLMLIIRLIPAAFTLGIVFEVLPMSLLPLVALFGVSLPAFLSALIYSPFFKTLEPHDESEDKDPDATPESLLEDTPIRIGRAAEEPAESNAAEEAAESEPAPAAEPEESESPAAE